MSSFPGQYPVRRSRPGPAAGDLETAREEAGQTTQENTGPRLRRHTGDQPQEHQEQRGQAARTCGREGSTRAVEPLLVSLQCSGPVASFNISVSFKFTYFLVTVFLSP